MGQDYLCPNYISLLIKINFFVRKFRCTYIGNHTSIKIGLQGQSALTEILTNHSLTKSSQGVKPAPLEGTNMFYLPTVANFCWLLSKSSFITKKKTESLLFLITKEVYKDLRKEE